MTAGSPADGVTAGSPADGVTAGSPADGVTAGSPADGVTAGSRVNAESVKPCGILIVDKPRGPTSHDVVAQARRVLGTRAVGHAGTLDPMASGVLVLLVGQATKLSAYLTL
ncbi:MAG TPA: hypothetical protein VF395_16365, partial [Polyangiaceae bacterium]